MGVFFFTHSVALAEDLTLEAHYSNLDDFYKDVNASYEQVNPIDSDLKPYNKQYLCNLTLF